ncbi:hypothetical protein MnTg02_00871 [bacterium MnTg02]|nr:hypothetical protein MnTg02_00871 [bacterium MnTg02]
MLDMLVAFDQQLDTVLLHGREMRTAGNQRYVRATLVQHDPEISSNRSGAVNADFHNTFHPDIISGPPMA